VILGEYQHITEGDTVKTTGKILSVPIGPELLGRVVNSLGQPIDGKGPINAKETDVIEKVAPGVVWRKSVSQPVQTGLKAIDSMVPVGRGQRELIIGDRQTGKTGGRGRYHHQPEGQGPFLRLRRDRAEGLDHRERGEEARRARRHGVHRSSWPPPPPSPRPCSTSRPIRLHHGRVLPRPRPGRAHHLRRPHEAGLGVPQVSLLLRRPPGREAYPGDVFYLHSRLLERGARVNEEYVERFTNGKVKGKTGSLTALPIIETQAGDVTAFVPTNVISITDGQIFSRRICSTPASAPRSTPASRCRGSAARRRPRS
jgi:F-type H+-transporting ATPase subunit alpha